MCWWILSIVICLIIGLPCTIMSCNEWICPMQYDLQATAIYSTLTPNACIKCVASDADGGCVQYQNFACIITGFLHPLGACGVRTPRYYTLNETQRIFVHKYSHDCSLPTITDDHIAYVGIIFLVLSLLSILGCIINMCQNNK